MKKERKVIKTRKKDGKKGRKNTEKKIRIAKIYRAEMNQREDYARQKKS